MQPVTGRDPTGTPMVVLSGERSPGAPGGADAGPLLRGLPLGVVRACKDVPDAERESCAGDGAARLGGGS
jgi:hypothetical protein